MSDDDRERWNRRYRQADSAPEPPNEWLVSLDGLPVHGRALDVAGGSGRNAIWLALRGLTTTLVDISPVALTRAREHASAVGAQLHTAAMDLEQEPLPLLDPAQPRLEPPWDLIVNFAYLNRPLLRAYASLLAPGGWLVFGHPTVRNLERHERPPRRFLLEEGELARFADGLEVLQLDEAWRSSGRHIARLYARRP